MGPVQGARAEPGIWHLGNRRFPESPSVRACSWFFQMPKTGAWEASRHRPPLPLSWASQSVSNSAHLISEISPECMARHPAPLSGLSPYLPPWSDFPCRNLPLCTPSLHTGCPVGPLKARSDHVTGLFTQSPSACYCLQDDSRMSWPNSQTLEALATAGFSRSTLAIIPHLLCSPDPVGPQFRAVPYF